MDIELKLLTDVVVLGLPPSLSVASGESGAGDGSRCSYFPGNAEQEHVWPLASSKLTSALPLARRSIHSSVHMTVPFENPVGTSLSGLSSLGQACRLCTTSSGVIRVRRMEVKRIRSSWHCDGDEQGVETVGIDIGSDGVWYSRSW